MAHGLPRFARVGLASRAGGLSAQGTIVWRCRTPLQSPIVGTEPSYLVRVDGDPEEYRLLGESDLEWLGPPAEDPGHLATENQLSFDFALGPDMDVVEGSVRGRGEFWRPFLVLRGEGTETLLVERELPSGARLAELHVPPHVRIDEGFVVAELGRRLGLEPLSVVNGPDSVALR